MYIYSPLYRRECISGVAVPCIERVIDFRCFQSLVVAPNVSDDVECGEFCEVTANPK